VQVVHGRPDALGVLGRYGDAETALKERFQLFDTKGCV
jgi:hypothetical protein